MKASWFLFFFIPLKGISFSLPAVDGSIKLHLTFNQPAYVPGDTAYLRGRLFSINNFKPVSGMHVVNIKLINENSKVVLFNKVVFNDGVGISQIVFPNGLATGVYDLVAYTDEMAKLSYTSSFFYTRMIIAGKKQIYRIPSTSSKDSIGTSENNALITILANLEYNEYSVRTPVNLEILVKNQDNSGCISDFSISVYKEELFPSSPQEGLCSIRLPDSPQPEESIPQKQVYFSGKAYYTKTKKAVPDSTFVTFYLNRQEFVYGLHVKEGGNFDFPLFMDLGDDELFYAMEYKGKKLKNIKIDVLDYSIKLNEKVRDSLGQNYDPYTSFSNLKKTILGSYSYFLTKNSGLSSEGNTDLNESFDVDYIIDLEKFKEFPTIQETLHEIVPLVQCKPMNGKIGVRVFLQSAMLGSENPLYVIDGIMTDSTEFFLSLDPNQVRKIGVMRTYSKLKKYGALGKNGILVVTTKGANNGLVPKSSLALSIIGVNRNYQFIARNYNIDSKWVSRIPDLRTTLYWNPRIVTDSAGKAKISFSTGDTTGTYGIQIEGITDEGLPFSYHTRFKVSEN